MFRTISQPFKYLRTARQAQTVSELAIFGAIVIFILGIIIRQSIQSDFRQDQTLKAMRLALRESFEAGEQGNASRNVASVIFVEDRKSPDANKFGTLERTPHSVTASGSFTKNLFMPTDFGNEENLPLMDMFINGKHFTFTTAGFRSHGIAEGQEVRKIVPNVPGSSGASEVNKYDPNCAECFDLDCDGTPDVPASARADFTWQWQFFKPTKNNIDIDGGKNVVADFDDDCKEEQALEVFGGGAVDSGGHEGPGGPDHGNPHPGPDEDDEDLPNVATINVIDSQAGDIDLTFNTRDRMLGKPRPGLTQNQKLYAFRQDGTIFAVVGSSSGQQQNRVEVVEREIQLSNNTGRMCGGANPEVEVCGNCQSPANIYRTCFEPSNNILYVRSRFKDLKGRVWITPDIQ